MKTFREFLQLEQFDSSLTIKRLDRPHHGVYHYYLDVGGHEYMIFAEYDDHIKREGMRIGFVYRHPNGQYIQDGEMQHLTPKEVLALFGTVQRIIGQHTFKDLFIFSEDEERMKIYMKMVPRLEKEFNLKRDTLPQELNHPYIKLTKKSFLDFTIDYYIRFKNFAYGKYFGK